MRTAACMSVWDIKCKCGNCTTASGERATCRGAVNLKEHAPAAATNNTACAHACQLLAARAHLDVLTAGLYSLSQGFDGHLHRLHAAQLLVVLLQILPYLHLDTPSVSHKPKGSASCSACEKRHDASVCMTCLHCYSASFLQPSLTHSLACDSHNGCA